MPLQGQQELSIGLLSQSRKKITKSCSCTALAVTMKAGTVLCGFTISAGLFLGPENGHPSGFRITSPNNTVFLGVPIRRIVVYWVYIGVF